VCRRQVHLAIVAHTAGRRIPMYVTTVSPHTLMRGPLPVLRKGKMAGIAYSSWKIQEFERGSIATAGSGEATAETHFMPRVFADVADYLDWEAPYAH
jgi:hypothetical protein